MKKYFFALTALVLAVALSAFTTKPTASEEFKLNFVEPTSSAAVDLQSNWIEAAAGTVYGTCNSMIPDAVACNIILDATNQDKFYHENGDGNKILNTVAYVTAQSTNNSIGLGVIDITSGRTIQNAPSGLLQGKDVYTITSLSVHAGTGYPNLNGTVTRTEANYY